MNIEKLNTTYKKEYSEKITKDGVVTLDVKKITKVKTHLFDNGLTLVAVLNGEDNETLKIKEWFFTKQEWFDEINNEPTTKAPEDLILNKYIYKMYPMPYSAWRISSEKYDLEKMEKYIPEDVTTFNKWDMLVNHHNGILSTVDETNEQNIIDLIIDTYTSLVTPTYVKQSLQNVFELYVDVTTKINKSDSFSYWLRKHTNTKTIADAKNVIRKWQQQDGYYGLFNKDNNNDTILDIRNVSKHTQENFDIKIQKDPFEEPEVTAIRIIQTDILYLKNKYKTI